MNKLIFLLCLFPIALPAAPAALKVHEAWVREAPPVIKVTAGYIDIENVSGDEQVLVAASSPGFDSVEIHKTEIEDGIARMLKQEELILEPGSRIRFFPGGYHLMLINSHAPVQSGDNIEITLYFSNNTSTTLQAEVRKQEKKTEHHHH